MVDDTGVSGIGIVATGVMWPNGWCAMGWLTEVASIAIYPNVASIIHIHGHGGSTELEWIDNPVGE